MELSLSGEGKRFEGEAGLRRLRRLAELQIKKELEPIKGVAAVRVRGGLEEEIHVLLEEEALRRTGISIQQVIDRLAQENINVAGGTLKEGRTEYLVRTLNEYENLDQIAETIVATLRGPRGAHQGPGPGRLRAQGTRDPHPHRRRRERPDRDLQGRRRQHRRAGQAGHDAAGRVRLRGSREAEAGAAARRGGPGRTAGRAGAAAGLAAAPVSTRRAPSSSWSPTARCSSRAASTRCATRRSWAACWPSSCSTCSCATSRPRRSSPSASRSRC